MKSKASVARDFMKVSRDLEEALARGAFTACELRIIAWLKARTYGVRIKEDEHWVALDATPITANFLSSETGLNRGRVKESINALLTDQVLRQKANGWVGINSRIGDWKRTRAGRDFRFDDRPSPDMGPQTCDRSSQGQAVTVRGGQGVTVALRQGVTVRLRQGVTVPSAPSKERARVEALEKQSGERTPTLPNGKDDTPTARAEAGLSDFAPMDHPTYSKLSFKVQDRLAERWEARVTEERKKTACKRCQQAPRAANWPYCRACTSCSDCGQRPDGKTVFSAMKNGVFCAECKPKEAVR